MTIRCLACGRLILVRCSVLAKTSTGLVTRVCNSTCRNNLAGSMPIPAVQKLAPVATPESIRKPYTRWTGSNRRR